MCLIEAARDSRPAVDWDLFRRAVDVAAADPRLDRLVLAATDGVAESDLVRRVAYARDRGGFRHIRVQSDGRRWADVQLTRAVRAAGVDEWCIAVSAHSAASAASIAASAAAFAQGLAGLENIGGSGATLITATAVVECNVHHLTDIAELVLRFRPARVELYNLISTRPDEGALLAPLSAIQPALQDALDRLRSGATERAAVWFPRCILGPHDDAFASEPVASGANEQARAAGARFHCFYGRACSWYGPCQGLAEPYIERFGWETGRLVPQEGRRGDPAPRRESARRDGGDALHPAETRWLELLGGPDGEPMQRTALWSLERVSQRDCQVRFEFALPNGERYELVLEPRDDRARRHAQTAGFNVSMVPIGSSPRRFVSRLLLTLLPIISRNDDGRLRLD